MRTDRHDESNSSFLQICYCALKHGRSPEPRLRTQCLNMMLTAPTPTPIPPNCQLPAATVYNMLELRYQLLNYRLMLLSGDTYRVTAILIHGCAFNLKNDVLRTTMKDFNLLQGRLIARIYALFKAYTGRRAWKAIGNRLLKPRYLSRDDHNRKIRTRKQRTDIGKYFFANRTIKSCNQLPAGLLASFPCNLN